MEVELPELLDGLKRYGSLVGFVDACVHMAKGMPLHDDALLHGSIVYGTQYAHIEGYGVAA